MNRKLLPLTAIAALALGLTLRSAPASAVTLADCLNQVIAGAEPGAVCYDVFQITAKRVAGYDPFGIGSPATDPIHPAWSLAAPTTVNLVWQIKMDVNTPAPAIENSFMNLGTPDLTSRVFAVQAIHDGASITYKIVFPDATNDSSIADVPLFHDGLAVAVLYDERMDPVFARCHADDPLDPQPDLLHMGNWCTSPMDQTLPHPCCPSHLLFWRSDKAEIENVVANGPGTAAETFETDVGLFSVTQSWAGGAWTVLMTRPLLDPYPPESTLFAPGLNMVTLEPSMSYDIVFANWDGSQEERNGYKYIGPWGKLLLEP